MSVRLDGDMAVLSGECGLDDCERLLAGFSSGEARRVDLSQAGALHTAVFQVLLLFRPSVLGTPRDEFFAVWLLPLLLTGPSDPQSTGQG